jgi:hypothetical protein
MDGGVQPPRIEPAYISLLLSEGDGQTQRCEGGKGRTATRIEDARLRLCRITARGLGNTFDCGRVTDRCDVVNIAHCIRVEVQRRCARRGERYECEF